MTAERPGPAALARLARTRSAPGDRTLLLDAAHSRRLVLLKALLTRLERQPAAVGPGTRERFESHWRLLERTEARHPGPVRETLGYPSVGHWLARALAAPDGEALGRLLGHFGTLAAAAALRAGEDFTLRLAAPGGALALPGIGLATGCADAFRITARGHTARLTADGRGTGPLLRRAGGRIRGTGPGWRGLHRLPGSAACLDDLDPYRAPAEGVGRRSVPAAARSETADDPWLPRWRAALSLLRTADPERAAETTALLRSLVPLAGADAGGGPATAMSATFRAAPGAVLATLPGTAADLADVLVHETQHSKLSVLHDLVPLFEAGPEAAYRVAWRADPRPFAGVVQGTYAHLALADFWARTARLRALTPTARRGAVTRRDSYRRQVAEALPILLESSELTPAGREFAVGMERHLAALGRAGGLPTVIGGASPPGDVR
ncbi:HEXXH motif-containing protein [Streptomyces olivoverticillatus]|uniref:HEXXH motif-containing protein n=1 Tax=Streptomyces olivoverticillatus TaxID=66427 RepID=A0A7W7LJE5_9ACTN|nr:HEXXH motif-containing putative peptide modification protein [Streptomyces olivoverticillatus]MBB4891330.1 HEXXH motif-containing protein [Streptomyces olivoverticillatus]